MAEWRTARRDRRFGSFGVQSVSVPGNGRRLTAAELATARLTLPCPLPRSVTDILEGNALLGAGFAVTVPVRQGPECFEEHLIAVYSFERLLKEALDHSPGRELLQRGYLPLGDGGRHNPRAYFVTLNSAQKAELYSWTPGTDPSPLGVCLKDLSARARAVPGLLPRRRLPTKQRAVRRSTTAGGRAARKGSSPALVLDLFPAVPAAQ